MIKKILNFLTVIFLAIAVSSCASVPAEKKAATLEKYDGDMFWEIEGIDNQGNPSKIYVLGTIHVADDRIYPVSENILDAFYSADRVYAELAAKDLELVPILMTTRIFSSMEKEQERIEATGKYFTDYLTEEENNWLKTNFSEDMLNQLKLCEPWVLFNTFNNLVLQQTDLVADKGYDMYFYNLSKLNNKEVLGLDKVKVQLDLISYGDWDTQLEMVKNFIDESIEDPNGELKGLNELYELYILGEDGPALQEFYAKEEADEPEYYEDYKKALIIERNIVWAEKFKTLLAEGGITFVFAGTGHFTDDDSVFELMREQGSLEF